MERGGGIGAGSRWCWIMADECGVLIDFHDPHRRALRFGTRRGSEPTKSLHGSRSSWGARGTLGGGGDLGMGRFDLGAGPWPRADPAGLPGDPDRRAT